jgi:hypothetical protein
MFLHGFEKSGLSFRRRAIDFVGENDVREHGTFRENERALPWLICLLQNIGAGDVGRHEVGRELNAAETERHHLRKGIDDGGFREAGNAHEQTVAARENTNEQSLDDEILADNDLGDFGANFLINFAQRINGGDVVSGGLRCWLRHKFEKFATVRQWRRIRFTF